MTTGLSPLGSITDFASPVEGGSVETGLSDVARDYCRRLHARRVAGRLLWRTPVRRVAGCGWRLIERPKGIGLWQRPDAARGRVSGVCLCGSSWVCPVCAPRISAGRVGEVKELGAAAVGRGYRLKLETRTLPHRMRDSVEAVIRMLQEASREMSTGKRGEILRVGRVGYCDAGELTWGANGAHPHFHRMAIVEEGKYDTEGQRTAWLAALERVGRRTKGVEQHAFHSRDLTADSAWYLSKIGLETASSALETKDSLTPLGMVYGIADGRLPLVPWGSRFRECAVALRATKFAALRFSRGLRAEFGLKVEKSDEELAKEETSATDCLLGYLNEPQWLGIRERRIEGDLVFVAQEGREAVNAWLRDKGLGHLHEDTEELLEDADIAGQRIAADIALEAEEAAAAAVAAAVDHPTEQPVLL